MMELLKNIIENEFGAMEGEVYFGYIDEYIQISFKKNVPMEYVYKTAKKLNEITDEIMYEVCKYSVEYCKDTLEDDMDIEIDIDELDEPMNILEYMGFDGLIVNMPENMEDVGLNLEGHCDWDEEIGIQCIIKNDKVDYVGMWNRWDMWNNSYIESGCNYVKNKC